MAQTQNNESVGPLDDIAYDLVTILHEKSKGLEAYEKYLKDSSGKQEIRSLLEELKAQDVSAVQKLRECTARYLNEGTQS